MRREGFRVTFDQDGLVYIEAVQMTAVTTQKLIERLEANMETMPSGVEDSTGGGDE